MTLIKAVRFLGIGTSLLLLSLGGQAQQNYGMTEFEATGAAEAQPAFLRGLLQLHNFEYPDARASFQEALAIDPEHRQAHYNRMLSLRAQGRGDEAALGEAAFERYSIDEAAQAVTRAYRAENPGVNLMAQDIHTHELRPLAPAEATASPDRPASGGGGP